jgi:hypothetical protein
MAPPTLLAKGSCRNGHVIASEDDLVGTGRHRQCRACRYETNRRWREREYQRWLAERDAAFDRYELAHQAWVRAGRKGPKPAYPSL